MNSWEGTERELTKVRRESVGSQLTADVSAGVPAGNTRFDGTRSPADEGVPARRSTEVTPIWFGSEERPLFGMFQVPESGLARAGVVVCPPFGRDLLHAHYTLRCLGDEMAARGVCTLRFDYDGTGDSAGTGNDPQRVRSWLDSIAAAVATMRTSGVESVFVVGMGLGATLAAQVVGADENIDGLVLWDPEPSGKSYISRQRALSALSFNVTTTTTDGSLDLPGIVFDALTASDLRKVELSNLGKDQTRMLVLVRPDRDATRLQDRLRGDLVEWGEAIGHALLIDDGMQITVPKEALDRVVKWIDTYATHEPQLISVPGRTGPMSIPGPSGRSSMVETPVWVGDTGMFGIVTESPAHNAGPTVIFLSVSQGHRIGPARSWVDLARRLAETGQRSVRIDFSGLGDSPLRHKGQRQFEWCAPEAFDDVEEIARWCSPADPSNVILVGLCASGYQAIESAFYLTPRGVVAINPSVAFLPPEVRDGGSIDPRRRVVMESSPLQERFRSDSPLVRVRRKFPRLAWRVKTWRTPSRQRSAAWLQELDAVGSDVLIVSGEESFRPIRYGASPRLLKQLEDRGRLRLACLPELEHGLLIGRQRLEVQDLVTEHVQMRFGCKNPRTVTEKEPEKEGAL
jgi:pimeloyl-ACP methyl ester carboxylesterase